MNIAGEKLDDAMVRLSCARATLSTMIAAMYSETHLSPEVWADSLYGIVVLLEDVDRNLSH